MGKIADFSHNNGHVDWSKAKDELDFAIIRVQYGTNIEDRLHKENEDGCKKNGVQFGEYAYGHYTSIADAKNEAQVFLNRIDKSAKFLMLDVEKDTIASCGTKNLAEASQAFIDTCKAAGYKIGFYVSHELYKEFGLDQVKADFLMLPRYGKDNGTPDIKPDYPCDIWQYTQKGKLAGVNGNVDLSLLNGSKTLDWFIGSAKVTEQKATSQPTPTQSVDSADGRLTLGEQGSNCQQLNLWLHELTYTDNVSNEFNLYTQNALKAFQKDHNLPQDGVYTSAVGDVIQKAIAAKKNLLKLDTIPVKNPQNYRLAKYIDTNDEKVIQQYRTNGFILIEAPSK